jgi:Gpi18-like mannosyltransferase
MTNDQFSVSAGGQSFRPSSIVLRQLVSSLPVVTLLILALLAAAPLWGPGIVNTRAGGDSPFLLWRTHQMAANLRAGVFPVRWMPDAAYGYGYPFFSYYAALPFYLAGLLHVVGLDILTAIKLTQTLGFIAAAFAMYGWMRRHLSQAGAWLAAVAYTFAAFHLVNVYTRGDSLS